MERFNGKTFVLSIGIDKYEDTSISKLRGARNDAVGISDLFGSEKIVLLDEKASREEIFKALDDISRQATADDTFIFTFSGHGDALGNGENFHLLVYDSTYKESENMGISSIQLREYFRRIRAKSKFVLIDSCHSSRGFEGASDAFVENNPVLKRLNEEDILFIGTDQITQEKPFIDESGKEIVNGILSRVVIDGLMGAADINTDKQVSSNELQAFLYKEMFNEKFQNCEPKQSKSIDQKGNIISFGSSEKITVLYSPRTIFRGNSFEILAVKKSKNTTDKLEESSKNEKKETVPSDTSPTESDTRSKIAGARKTNTDKPPEWKGESHAILFANDKYDNSDAWQNLRNPQNDVTAVASELKQRYGFISVETYINLTTDEIYEAIEKYRNKKFKNKEEDQLFIFFAGHGITNADGKSGYYIGKDSPAPPVIRTNEHQFVSLNGITTVINQIPVNHIMIMFDACFAGKIWEAPIVLTKQVGSFENRDNENYNSVNSGYNGQNTYGVNFLKSNYNPSNTLQNLNKFQYAKWVMKNKSFIIVTSGDKPVYDYWIKPDGTKSTNSPFADAFLRALKNNGGDDEVIDQSDYKPLIKNLEIEPQLGNLEGTDGDFVFVKRD